MKKVIVILIGVMFLLSQQYIIAQTKETKKERDNTNKELKKKIKEKASKPARKEGKRLTKEGWKPEEGTPPIEKQLDDTWMKIYEESEDGYPKFIVAGQKAVGNIYSSAYDNAFQLAKSEIAGLIATQVAGLTDINVANNQLSPQEAVSVNKTVTAYKNLVAQELARVVPVLRIYRVLPNKNFEVEVRIAYNTEIAMEAARKILVKKLEEETEIQQQKLESLMGLDKLKAMKENTNIKEE